MDFKKIKFIAILFIPLLLNGCFTSMGLFRGAKVIGKNQYEFSPRWQSNSGIQALGVNYRYGLNSFTDMEIFGVGLFAEKAIGIQGSITMHLYKIDWFAIGAQGFVSTFNRYGGLRTIIGNKFYCGYEMNYVIDDEFYLRSQFFTHNLFFGNEQEINLNIFTSGYPVITVEFGLQFLPFNRKPNYLGGISLKFVK